MKTDKLSSISMSRISPGKNDRTEFEPIALQELADLMRDHGLIEPIIIHPISGGYEICAGERRYRAAQLLGWAKIDCVIRKMTPEEASTVMLIENLQRVELNPIDEASAYASRIKQFEWTIEVVADVAKVTPARVRKMVALLSLAKDIQKLVASKQLGLAYASLMTVLDFNRQHAAVKFLNSAKNVSLSMFKQFIGQLQEQQSQDAMFDLAALFVEKAKQAEDKKVAQVPLSRPGRALPEIRVDMKRDNTATIMLRWIADLRKEGKVDEADTMALMYNQLVKSRWIYNAHVDEIEGESHAA